MTAVVIGVGNDFRQDDGVGWAVVRRLRGRCGGASLAFSDGDPGRLIGLWDGAELAVVVDAAHAHPGRPGRVHRLEAGAASLREAGPAGSHGLGLGEAVALAEALGRLPDRLVVFAVEVAETSPGLGLSPPVEAAVEPLAQRIGQELARRGCPDGPARGAPAGAATED